MKIEPATAIRGHIAVPGDKSISHRAVLLGAIGEGETLVRGFGRSRDTESTIAAVGALGDALHARHGDVAPDLGRRLDLHSSTGAISTP